MSSIGPAGSGSEQFASGRPPSTKGMQKITASNGVVFYYKPPSGSSLGVVVIPKVGWFNNVSSASASSINTEAPTGQVGGAQLKWGGSGSSANLTSGKTVVWQTAPDDAALTASSGASRSAPQGSPQFATVGQSGHSMGEFFTDVLTQIGAPVTQHNINLMLGWAQAEGGDRNNYAAWNPLNTTQGSGVSINSVGVKAFSDYSTGVLNTAQTLTNGYYGSIVKALQSGASDPQQFASLVGSSKWGTGSRLVSQTMSSVFSGARGSFTGSTGLRGQGPGGSTDPAGWGKISGTSGAEFTGPTAKDPNAQVSIDTYGYIARLAKSEPDLAKLMKQYAGEDLSNPNVQQRLEADIENTHWWTSHNAEYRKQEVLKATDPATFQNDIQQAVQGVKQHALSYFVPMSDKTAQSWATKITSAQVTGEDYVRYLQEQAKSMFPALSDAIDKGLTVADYTKPYQEHAANLLEQPPESVDMMKNPTFQKALFNIDPKTGQRNPMSLADWDTYIRGLPQYANTSAANDMAAQFAQSITNMFGKTA